ncbi:DUF5652 family protein [Kribbella sp. NPDC026596]|uniref:DUF5652 family protein n=1 Tax=Kribbella sp. NPDC026596 TaxID=3155122 RepID=UPI00340AAC39
MLPVPHPDRAPRSRPRRRGPDLGGERHTLSGASPADLPLPGRSARRMEVGWAVAITLINSVGAVPIAYFVHGRRPRS